MMRDGKVSLWGMFGVVKLARVDLGVDLKAGRKGYKNK